MSEKLDALRKRLEAQDGGTLGDIFELIKAEAEEHGIKPIEFMKLVFIRATKGNEAFIAAAKKLRGTVQ